MIPTVRRGDGQALAAAIDIAPLIDVVFILLIFFLVTTSFVQETGVEVERPHASFAEGLAGATLRLVVPPSGRVVCEGERLEDDALRQRVRRFAAEHPDGAVVLIPDRRTPSGALVRVMDIAKAGGATRIAIATLRGAEGRAP